MLPIILYIDQNPKDIPLLKYIKMFITKTVE